MRYACNRPLLAREMMLVLLLPSWLSCRGTTTIARTALYIMRRKNVQIKLFTDFYASDVIVASPLALATRAADGRDDGADFLSSVEVALVLRADVMLMQNWAHVEAAFAQLNGMPKAQHSTDIMRVRCAPAPCSLALRCWAATRCTSKPGCVQSVPRL
jgi:Utp25, U3 small nucleolar RNA-associated SSU processome protein 25